MLPDEVVSFTSVSSFKILGWPDYKAVMDWV